MQPPSTGAAQSPGNTLIGSIEAEGNQRVICRGGFPQRRIVSETKILAKPEDGGRHRGNLASAGEAISSLICLASDGHQAIRVQSFQVPPPSPYGPSRNEAIKDRAACVELIAENDEEMGHPKLPANTLAAAVLKMPPGKAAIAPFQKRQNPQSLA